MIKLSAYLPPNPFSPTIRRRGQYRNYEIIGSSVDFAGLHSERAGQMELLTRFRAAGDAKGSLRVMPIVNHFAAVENPTQDGCY
ncbi:hypothetical protein [Bradyrhizobium australiense]|uniref:Uncharacterized protein n=1 Tax=Bradyrhizobium australiense TaxID=2721161 RepID=A0A7Y4GP07_9BRAD|nr:hypothetical protein [Bradyrhizobium australiense]NOJ39191.1 hypothetical protein [Bradyrhizobium australiense]